MRNKLAKKFTSKIKKNKNTNKQTIQFSWFHYPNWNINNAKNIIFLSRHNNDQGTTKF